MSQFNKNSDFMTTTPQRGVSQAYDYQLMNNQNHQQRSQQKYSTQKGVQGSINIFEGVQQHQNYMFGPSQTISQSNQKGFQVIQQQQQHQQSQQQQQISQQNEKFEVQLQVVVKSFEREERQLNLNLKIYMVSSTNSGQHSQVLHLELTDELSPQWLYVQKVTESDFHQIKAEQNLIIDFYSYQRYIQDAVERVLQQQQQSNKGTTQNMVQGVYQYVTSLEIKNNQEGVFCIAEQTQFRLVPQLSMRFRPATDEYLKSYLAQRLLQEKRENGELRIRCGNLEENLEEKVSVLEELRQRFRVFEDEKGKTIESLSIQEQRKVNEIREIYLEKEETLRREFERVKEESKEKYEKQIKQMMNEEVSLKHSLQISSEKCSEQERTLREWGNKINVQDKELEILKKEVEALRRENKELDQTKFQQEKKITELTLGVQSLEKQIKDKENLVENSKSLVDNSQNQRLLLENTIESQKKQIEKLEKRIELCSEEINKGNSIIEKLQNDIQTQKQKVKGKNQIVIQQEQVLKNFEEKIDNLKNKLAEAEKEKDHVALNNKEKENKIEELKSKLQESQNLIEQNKSMIAYLNQQLNENKTNYRSSSIGGVPNILSSKQLPTSNSFYTGRPLPLYENNKENYNYSINTNLDYSQTMNKSPIGKTLEYLEKSPNINANKYASNLSNLPSNNNEIHGDLSKYLSKPQAKKTHEDEEFQERPAPIKYNKFN